MIYEPGSEPSSDVTDELSKLQNYNKYSLFISYMIYGIFVVVKTDQDISFHGTSLVILVLVTLICKGFFFFFFAFLPFLLSLPSPSYFHSFRGFFTIVLGEVIPPQACVFNFL